MGLIFTPVLVRRLLRPSGRVWAYDWHFLDSYSYSKRSGWTVWPASGFPPTPAPSHPPTPLYMQSVILHAVVAKKVAQNPAVLASYYR